MAAGIPAVVLTSAGAVVTLAVVTLAVVAMQVVAGMVDIEGMMGATPSGRSAAPLPSY